MQLVVTAVAAKEAAGKALELTILEAKSMLVVAAKAREVVVMATAAMATAGMATVVVETDLAQMLLYQRTRSSR